MKEQETLAKVADLIDSLGDAARRHLVWWIAFRYGDAPPDVKPVGVAKVGDPILTDAQLKELIQKSRREAETPLPAPPPHYPWPAKRRPPEDHWWIDDSKIMCGMVTFAGGMPQVMA